MVLLVLCSVFWNVPHPEKEEEEIWDRSQFSCDYKVFVSVFSLFSCTFQLYLSKVCSTIQRWVIKSLPVEHQKLLSVLSI